MHYKEAGFIPASFSWLHFPLGEILKQVQNGSIDLADNTRMRGDNQCMLS